MSDAYRGLLGRKRKRWIDEVHARMEADPEYQRILAEHPRTPHGIPWEVVKWEFDSEYFDKRPWYWHVYWTQQKILDRYYDVKFYIRRHVLKIRRPDGYWHYTHADILICPDCDFDGNWCSEPYDEHACTAQILTTADVHKCVEKGYLTEAKCVNCGIMCPA